MNEKQFADSIVRVLRKNAEAIRADGAKTLAARVYKAEVIADSSGKWIGNGLTFPDVARAEAYALDLFSRWTSVREWRVVDDTGAVYVQGPNPNRW